MTLIVAGYTGSSGWGRKSYDQIFFVGDTLLSNDGRTGKRERLIEIFRKVRSIPVKIWIPQFDTEDYFSRYLESFSSTCVIAYAGSTLTFSHMLNGIEQHLSQLRYGYNVIDRQYEIVKHCSEGALGRDYSTFWAKDINFSSQNLPALTADFQMEVISHVIRRALKDVSAHRLLDQNSFNSIRCQLAIALYCWQTHKPVLYRVDVVLSEEYPRYATLECRRLGEHEVTVLGKPSKPLQDEVQQLINESRKEPEPPVQKANPGEIPDRGTSDVRAAKAILRREILADEKQELNYIGGLIDCWEFSYHGHTENWYEKITLSVAIDAAADHG